MRAISPFARYSIVLSNPPTKRGVDRTGAVVEYSDGEPLLAQFEVSGLTAWEEAEAIEHFGGTLSGLPEGVNPLTRVSVFDSELFCVGKFSDPEARADAQAFIDRQLADKAEQYPSHFRIVDLPVASKPWPSYDDLKNLDKIMAVRDETGTDPSVVLRYESENKARPEVIEAMESLIAEANGATAEESIRVAL